MHDRIFCFMLVIWNGLLNIQPLLAVEDRNDWWKHAIVYQIYPRSFQDTDGDGIGDIKGIISRLKHLEDIGIGAIWLSPIYKSPMVDFGYDISDHNDIDPIFGTMVDFEELITEVHLRKMRLIMDFVPNHTSNQHPWFVSSESNGKYGKHANWYIWKAAKFNDRGQRQPPNNWLSIFGGSAWSWSEKRQMYYLHQFVSAQPDLNYRNREVIKAMQNVLSFWVKKGVDGFRVDAIDTLFENNYDQDEPRSNDKRALPHQSEFLDHIYTKNQPEIHKTVKDWRILLDELKKRMNDKHIFMVMEVYDETYEESMKYYDSGADMPFNMDLLAMNNSCGGACVTTMVTRWMDKMPPGKWPNFVMGNHDRKRITTRKGAQYASVMNMLLLLLPGTPTTYQGEEIGMLDTWVSYEDTQDPWGKNFGLELYEEFSRDPCRSPMQWNSGKNAGFSNADTTWLPVHSDYKRHNVQIQRTDTSGNSVLQVYRAAAKIRKRASFKNDKIQFITVNDDITSFIRHEEGHIAYLVILNLGKTTSNESYFDTYVEKKFEVKGKIVLNSGNCDDDMLDIGETINLRNITLEPAQGIVVELTSKRIPAKRDEL